MGNTNSGEEWLEEVVMQLSPNVVQIIKDVLRKEVEPSIDENMSEDGQKGGKFKFTKLDFGQEKPVWRNVSVHKSKEDGRRIVIDFDFVYNGDCDIEVRILGATSGVSSITMEGRARLILSPIIKRMPMVGGIQFQFLSLPAIGYQFDGIADLADLPIVKTKIRKSLEKKILKRIVYPNRASIALTDRSDPLLIHTLPLTGLLRVNLSVEDLPSKGGLRKVFKQGDPDVYCRIKFGACLEKVTSVVKNSNSASWDEWFEFPVEIFKGHNLEIEVWDHDSASRDDLLGRIVAKLDEESIAEDSVNYNLEPHPFKKSKNDITGIVTLQTKFIALSAEQTEEITDGTFALLSVFIYKLNGVTEASENSKLKVKISIEEEIQKSKKISEEENFEVMERFTFLMGSDFMEKTLNLKVMDKKVASGEVLFGMGEILECLGEKKDFALDGGDNGESVSLIFNMKFGQND